MRALTLGAFFVTAIASVAPAQARTHAARSHARVARVPEAHVQPGLRVSVQPIGGELGPAVRSQIARILRGRGCRVTTTLAAVSGTGQYLELAHDNRLAAFVSADLTEGPHRDSVTFLVWDGASGSVRGRWSASGSPKELAKAIAKGFWKSLGPSFDGAQAPPSDALAPAEPMYVNAGEPLR